MDDIWMLAFVFNGLIGAAGNTMPLKQCEAWNASRAAMAAAQEGGDAATGKDGA